ncbi:MAG: class I SAM-dependent methyltransferase [Oscillospiraceae bacterium]|nr:class I SAM-dependent methyltransferase [Oscillospiraceae bacterium]
MLEKMADFFKNRLDGYDVHMLTEIDGAEEFYDFTASMLPTARQCCILDLGCGTGLEAERYLKINPTAQITGIDLCSEMLDNFRSKFPAGDNIKLICGSYFDVPFGTACFDAAVSAESLHHFTAEQKLPLYRRLHRSLKCGGYFILTDYFAESEEAEWEYFEDLNRLKKDRGITDNEFYHYDTPLTAEHEIDVLRTAGFSSAEILRNWGATYTVKAYV